MKNMILLAALLVAFTVNSELNAQTYKSAVGARLGYPLSLSFKTFLGETSAVEVYAGTRGFGSGFGSYRWWIISGGYQIHKPIELDDLEGLEYYYGFGASVFFWDFGEGFSRDYSTTTFGAQAYAGLSYSFEETPVNITVDWVPTYFFNGFGSGFGAGYGTIGIRYILSR